MKKQSIFKLEGKEMLSKELMKELRGGGANVSTLKSEAMLEFPHCYQCCTPDYSVCGQCDYRGNGGCQGNGKPVYLCCGQPAT